ncbi:DNA-binding protein [Granulosicoccus sp.]|nr:DNA-binding protein [Granulosicoccus sp.]MDB4222217.1 DNA-binding protein [Granulosicoccus sp.]
MVDTPLVTKDSVAGARLVLIEQGRKPSQRSVIKLLGGGSFSQVGPILRELEAENGEAPGSALTEPLTNSVSEAVESLWRELGAEADKVVIEARQQFEKDLKAEQAARTQAEAAAARTQEALQVSTAKVLETEKSLAHESATLEQVRAALELERLAQTKTQAQLEAAESLATERKVLRDEAIVDRDRQASLLGPLQMKCDKQLEQLQQAIAEQRTEFEQRIESLSNELTASRTAVTEHKSELKNLSREKTNLETINVGLSARVDKTLASLSTVQAQVSGQSVLLDVEKEKVAALQVAMATRLDDKNQLIASLKKQVVQQSVVSKKKTKRKQQ